MVGVFIYMASKFQSSNEVAKNYFNTKRFGILKSIDKILSFIYSFLNSFRSNKKVAHEYKRILILESHLIGDVIMGLPAYQAIRENYSGAKLIFWGNKWGEDLLAEQGIFDDFIIAKIPWAVYDYSLPTLFKLFSQAIKLRKLNVDMALDFRGDIRNIFLLYLTGAKRRVSYDFTGGTYWLTDVVSLSEGLHIIDRNLNLLRCIGVQVKHITPKLQVWPNKVEDAKKYFKEKGYKKVVIIHPVASQKKKFWMPERFAHIIDFLQNEGFTPVLVCGPKDNDFIYKIKDKCEFKPDVLAVSLKDLPGYLSCCEFFIGIDSGIAHMAAALGKNAVVLFGPQLPLLTAPRGDGNIQVIIKGEFECRPCSGDLCKYNNNSCMEAIEIEDIKNVVHKMKVSN